MAIIYCKRIDDAQVSGLDETNLAVYAHDSATGRPSIALTMQAGSMSVDTQISAAAAQALAAALVQAVDAAAPQVAA